MEKRNRIILGAVLILVFLVVAAASIYLINTEKSNLNVDNVNDRDVGTDNSDQNAIDNGSNTSDDTKKSSDVPKSSKILGSTDYGRVTVEGPFGNSNSPVRIAVIVGVHPLESSSHKAMVESIKSSDKSLNYCYYIYRVTVTQNAGDYDKGRMNGQLLANKFVVPHVIGGNYNLALDIHSNRGNYKEKWFVFAPLEDGRSKSIALKLKEGLPGFVYYNPPSQTSPKYVTIPIINGGTPAVVYETYLYESYGDTLRYAKAYLSAVENLKL
ncbi:MAG: hypothetical protein QMD61_00835 [Methanobacterium sp.]|nr:hypothetical protein [Methanobacterium sp.]